MSRKLVPIGEGFGDVYQMGGLYLMVIATGFTKGGNTRVTYLNWTDQIQNVGSEWLRTHARLISAYAHE